MEWLIDLKHKFINLFPDGPIKIIKTHKDKNQYALVCTKYIIPDLFANLCGHDSKYKQLPDFIFTVSKSYIDILKKYMMFGDGHTENYGYSYTSESLKLISQFSFILNR